MIIMRMCSWGEGPEAWGCASRWRQRRTGALSRALGWCACVCARCKPRDVAVSGVREDDGAELLLELVDEEEGGGDEGDAEGEGSSEQTQEGSKAGGMKK